MGASHQSSRAASPPKEFELASGQHSPSDAGRAGSLGHGPMLRCAVQSMLCVPVILSTMLYSPLSTVPPIVQVPLCIYPCSHMLTSGVFCTGVS